MYTNVREPNKPVFSLVASTKKIMTHDGYDSVQWERRREPSTALTVQRNDDVTYKLVTYDYCRTEESIRFRTASKTIVTRNTVTRVVVISVNVSSYIQV